MASARSLHTFNRCKQVNLVHAGLLSKATKVPVVDPYAVQKLSQQENRQESKPKNNKAKTGKHTTKKKHQTKTTERSGIATSNGNYMHDDILCVIFFPSNVFMASARSFNMFYCMLQIAIN